jgi:hypothetical protein
VFHTLPCDARRSGSAAATGRGAAAGSTLLGPAAEGGSFVSRCLYQVMGASSSSSSLDSATAAFLGGRAGLGFDGASSRFASPLAAGGFLHVRLWNCQSLPTHGAVAHLLAHGALAQLLRGAPAVRADEVLGRLGFLFRRFRDLGLLLALLVRVLDRIKLAIVDGHVFLFRACVCTLVRHE